jgi:hypothetical protein
MTEPAGELPTVQFPDDDNLLGPSEDGDGRDRDLILVPDDGEEDYA